MVQAYCQLALTFNLTHIIIYALPCGSWLITSFSTHLHCLESPRLHPYSLYVCLHFPPVSILPCHRQMQLYLLINVNNTYSQYTVSHSTLISTIGVLFSGNNLKEIATGSSTPFPYPVMHLASSRRQLQPHFK